VRHEYVLRCAVGSPQTTPEHVAEAWRQIQRAVGST
jgi:hypothetical protein